MDSISFINCGFFNEDFPFETLTELPNTTINTLSLLDGIRSGYPEGRLLYRLDNPRNCQELTRDKGKGDWTG